ncbi:hypothetical protein UFOVP340_42 [uncultured Caudovirales phage]|uniref:Uncharacterized protein n=1 Tax=uncultured Caudovirales phage TaxID=2100421 RepID=A0A6J5M1T2_9CAUD|nr:hypothetical protein UFOVP340_42 [uncultured Caudovirales phage]
MSNIAISSPFLRAFTHATVTVGTSASTVLDAAITPARRISVIVQNQHATAVITVRFSESGTDGFQVKAGETISLDNYNGHIRCSSDTASTPVHIAFATA